MSAAQPVTPELRKWIVEQASAGQPPESVLKSMLASGWREEVAVAAMEETLTGFLDQHAKAAAVYPFHSGQIDHDLLMSFFD